MTSGPGDPLFVRQWHLDRSATPDAAIDLNVVPVWEDYTGRGVRVAVIDRPVEALHWDLDANYEGPALPAEHGAHGTQVAGLIAAERNGEGGVGVAYGARITGLGDSTSAVAEAVHYDVANISLGSRFPWDRTTDWSLQFADGAANGRDMLGTIFTVSSGNARQDYHDANLTPYTTSRHTIVVGAVGKSGSVSAYSSEGATLTVVAPSSSGGLVSGGDITTTDLMGTAGDEHGDYTGGFGGTSASAPMVAGVVALMLEANPDLGWRDVQEILAITARHTGSGIDASPEGYERFGWVVNGAGNVNGGGFHFSNDYGFGLVDALAAVRLAEVWAKRQISATELSTSATFNGSVAVPDAIGAPVEVTFEIGEGIVAERIDLAIGLDHGDARQIEITIISPSGTESILFYHRGENPDQFGIPRRFQGWKFGSNAFAGEDAAGLWTVRVADTVPGGSGTLRHLALSVYGEAESADDEYFYTNEYGRLAGVAHAGTLSDTGGIDTVNAAAVGAASRIDLSGRTASAINGKELTFAPGTLIEHAIGGDGDDALIGNAVANHLRGGRGDDRLSGLSGDDSLEGGRGADRLNGGTGDDLLFGDAGDDRLSGGEGDDTLFGGDGDGDVADYRGALGGVAVALGLAGSQQTGGAGFDTLTGIEGIVGSNGRDQLSGSSGANLLRGLAGNDILVGAGGDDVLIGDAGDDLLGGGSGQDTASYASASTGVTVDLALSAAQDTIGAGRDRLSGIERLLGSVHADRLAGDAAANGLSGGAGDDELFGRAGDDRLIGDAGNDLLDGGKGRDLVSYAAASRVIVDLSRASPQHTGGGGADTLRGIEGLAGSDFADRLTGSAADDILWGRDGSDVLDGGAGDDKLFGAAGTDTALYEKAPAGVTVNLARRGDQDTGGAGTDRLVGIERVRGSDHDDALAGDAAANALWGRGGNDRLSGGEGSDLLSGGAGDDLLDGGGGFDVARYEDAAAGVAVDLRGAGIQHTGGAGSDLLSGIEGLHGSDFADALTGDAGRNVLRGLGGSDLLLGGGGNDTLEGGAGDDVLTGGTGLRDVADYAGAAAGVTVALSLIRPQDTVGAGTDILTGIEDLSGSRHADRLAGDSGDSRIFGQGGDDLLSGGGGNDILSGGDGGDRLEAGAGSALMAGGAGNDLFAFAATGERNTILDFADGSDRIDLAAFAAGSYFDIYTQAHLFPEDRNLYIFVDTADDGIGAQLIVLQDFLLLNPFGQVDATDLILPAAAI